MVKEIDVDQIDVPEDYEVLDATALGRRMGFKRDTVLAYLSRRNFRHIPAPTACLLWGLSGTRRASKSGKRRKTKRVAGRCGNRVRTTALAITPSQTAQLRCLWPVETRTLTGRRRTNVEKLTDRLNAPIQGAAADGLKLALALLWEQRTECPGAVPVIVCHDEIVVVCDAEQATVAKAWLERAMTEGMDTVLTYAVEPGYRLARRSSLQSLGT